jgi:hypothetical protein
MLCELAVEQMAYVRYQGLCVEDRIEIVFGTGCSKEVGFMLLSECR